MSVAQYQQVSYGLTQALIPEAPVSIVSKRDPTANDKAQIGTQWINTLTNSYFVLTSIVANVATWASAGTGAGIFFSLEATGGNITADLGNIIATAGDIVATAGNIVATAGDVDAGNDVNATNAITATNGDITATNGNIVATLGSIDALAGNISAANGITATGGDIDAATGNINATVGDVTAGNDMLATNNITSTVGDITATAGSVNAGADVVADVNITSTTGNITATLGNVVVTAGDILLNGLSIVTGAGDPNGVVAAAAGSFYLNTAGAGINDRLWVNTTGAMVWTFVVTGA